MDSQTDRGDGAGEGHGGGCGGSGMKYFAIFCLWVISIYVVYSVGFVHGIKAYVLEELRQHRQYKRGAEQ